MIRKYTSSPNFFFWLIALSVMIALTVPVLIQDGMFMDGMLYTCVSHNLSKGIGTFWFPKFDNSPMSGLAAFHEQPPLAFGIQAIFYKVVGDTMYTERFYIFFTMCLMAWLINKLWKSLPVGSFETKMGWLPVILWITIPINFWAFRNNMLENTMGVFILASALLTFRSLNAGDFTFKKYILPGVFIFLATLTKGVPGFFPVALPFIYWLSMRKIKFKQCIVPTVILVLTPLILYGLLMLFPDSRTSLSAYFMGRLVGRVTNEHSVGNRTQIIGHLFTQQIPQLVLVACVLVIMRLSKKNDLLTANHRRLALLFALLGFAGSLPLALTLVQSDFYFNPALPFFAISYGLLPVPLVQFYVAKIKIGSLRYKIFRLAAMVVLIGTIVYSAMQIGKTSRQKELLHDVYIVGTIVSPGSDVAIPESMWNYWELRCYLVRYFNISLQPGNDKKYYLLARELHQSNPANYTKLNVGLLQYDIFVHR